MVIRCVALRPVTHSTYITVRLRVTGLALRALNPFYSPPFAHQDAMQRHCTGLNSVVDCLFH